MQNTRQPLRLEPWGREANNILKEVKKRKESKEKVVVVWNREKTML